MTRTTPPGLPARKPAPRLRPRTMSRNLKLSLVVAGVFVAVAAVFVLSARVGGTASQAADDPASVAVRPDSHRLSDPPGATVTFAEFLDFECEACGAAYPAVEQLRKDYGDRVTFVLRYFPIASHVNAERAARAVEAAAQQGRLEAMYTLMYDTQKEWGEQQVAMDDRFRGYAQRLGLDMARYDATYTDPRTLQRIRADQADGTALGVTGTPTFFVNGRKVAPKSYAELTAALDSALDSALAGR